MKRSTIISMMLMLLGICAIQAQGATYPVNALGDAGDGTCDAICTLRDAIQAANADPDNDVINFTIAGTITLGGTQLIISNNGTLTINGPGADQLTISGNNTRRVFVIYPDAITEINGVTISGGSSSNGGGIYNSGTLTLNNSTVSNNSATARGGGINNSGALNGVTLILNNSTVSNNSAPTGGGISNVSGESSPTLNLNNSTVSNNSASDGGGIFAQGETTVTLINSTVANNSASNGNGSGSGGGILTYFGTLTLNNSTVSNNSAVIYGGGIFNNFGTLTLNNSTVSNNSASLSGGGIFTRYILTLNNSIIANSSGGDCSLEGSGSVNATYSLVEDGSCGVTSGSNGNLTGDPMLGPLQNNGGPTMTHALLPGSIAIDAGSDLLIPVGLTTDQRGVGFARIIGAAVDMGAFEVQDADGDGVLDVYDACSGTVLPEDRPASLRRNRFYANASGDFIDAGGIFSGITVADTGGCSGIQIIEAAGLGSGHVRYGITRSALEAWIAALP